jgi:EAL domain-containing protein (putative c-di-GMP-specific phosphodiesterase class I)
MGHRTGLATLAAWAGRPGLGELTLAINLSVRQFRSEDFVWHVTAALDASGADARRLKLEITESLVLEQEDKAIEKMNRIRNLGVSFAMDDFGTGYASLSHLQKLPSTSSRSTRPSSAAWARVPAPPS